MKMKLVREVTISGFAADPDPNLTAPDPATTFVMSGAVGDSLKSSDTNIEGHRMCLRFIDGSTPPVATPGASADFTAYVLDDGATAAYGRQAWAKITAETMAAHAQLFAAPLKGTMFWRLTDVQNTGSATKVQVWAEESSSVEG